MENRNWLYSALTFIIAVLSVVLVSCRKENGDGIVSSSTSLTFPANGGSQNVTITSSSDWSVVNIPSWISATPSTGYKGRSVLVVTVSNNYSTSERTGGIIVGNGSDNVTISISQSAADVINEISANVSSLSFSADGESKNISITSNFSWETIDKPSWITISPSSGTKGTTNLTVTASKSSSTTSRTGTISLGKSSSATTSISVSQSAVASSGGSDKTFKVTGNGKSVKFKMIYVEGGTFTMGSTSEQGDDYYQTPHSVTITKGYYIGETEVTQALWYAIMGEKPMADKPYTSKWWYGFGEDDEYPAYSISYNDCLDFLNKLNALTGEKFRLPTDAEWEFAARGGAKSQGYVYSGSNSVDAVAWYYDNCYVDGRKVRKVATKQPNELKIYDMSGSVTEWCSDWFQWFDSSYQIDPKGPSTGSGHVQRNGGWDNGAKMQKISVRFNGANGAGIDSGLRLAL